MIINTGPANGTLLPMASKFAMFTKSPQTLGFTKGFSGGEFGQEIKFAGWDGIILTGACHDWTHIHIETDKVYFNKAKLLRFIQTKEFERLGSTTTQRSDVRIIVATNKNLEDMVAEGEFRDDLYYRIAVYPK